MTGKAPISCRDERRGLAWARLAALLLAVSSCAAPSSPDPTEATPVDPPIEPTWAYSSAAWNYVGNGGDLGDDIRSLCMFEALYGVNSIPEVDAFPDRLNRVPANCKADGPCEDYDHVEWSVSPLDGSLSVTLDGAPLEVPPVVARGVAGACAPGSLGLTLQVDPEWIARELMTLSGK